ncbi:ABC transporter permease [Brevibacillus dissolubilis]|uniref:ABC transporter permease n=1 Tax=Brevibacillus dissolubilis TaxID=1844116 RepID=UPI001116CA97|nr:ABC transporter permease subunit [Brevibacillus dissolubilis]
MSSVSRGRFPVSFWIGSVIVFVLVMVALLGPSMAPYGVKDQVKVHSTVVDGKDVIVSPPLPPSAEHLLGTDKWGYDLLTLLLYGARYTLFTTAIIALLRVVLGTIIGLYIGMAERRQNWWISIENAWSYMPVILPVYFLLVRVNINSPLSETELTLFFIAVVTILGIPSAVSSVRQKTEQIKEMPFVTAAESLGAGREHIIVRHVFPQLKEQLMIVFVMEIITVMSLMGQLGIFNLFVGGTLQTFSPDLYHSMTHEWAGLIGQSRGFIQYKVWVFFAPLTAFIIAVAGFTLMSKGLQARYQMTYERKPFV